MEMGFTEDQCKEALARYDYDENLALNYLLGGWIWSNRSNINWMWKYSQTLLAF